MFMVRVKVRVSPAGVFFFVSAMQYVYLAVIKEKL